MHLPRFVCGIGLLASATLPAQSPSPQVTARAILSAVDAQPAFGWHDGQLMAAGAGYKAIFTDSGMQFVPAFGAAAPHNLPVHWHTSSVHRGETPTGLADVAPTLRGDGIDFARGEVLEHFAVFTRGIEQTFTFSSLPPGGGDLVLRGVVDTELGIERVGDSGLRFVAPGIGSFLLDGVVGIDANGERCRGTMRCLDRVVEYVLPAAFVQRAALPLVLDPTWSNPLLIETSPSADRAPDVCHAISDYLVVWEHTFSATDHDVYGQVLGSDFGLTGPRQFLGATAADEREPCVASIDYGHYVVAYQQNAAIVARDFVYGSAPGPLLTVATNGSRPDLGGQLESTRHRAVCVWQDGISIQYAILDQAAGPLSVLAGPTVAFTGSTSAPFAFPAVSKFAASQCGEHCGSTSPASAFRWAIVAQRDWLADSDLHLRVIDLDGNSLGSLVLDSSLEDHDRADVDGNGRDWIVVWQRRIGSERDIVAQHVSLPYVSTTLMANGSGPVVIAGVAGRREILPSIAYIHHTCLIGYMSELTSNVFEPRLQSRTLIGCETCAGDAAIPGSYASSANTSTGPVIARPAVLPSLNVSSLVLYDYPDPTQGNNGQITAWGANFSVGGVYHFTGGCGASGTLMPTCVLNGNTNFRITLRDSLPFTNAWLVLSPNSISLPCGGCRLQADPFFGVVIGTALDATGAGSVPVPIPTIPAFQQVLLQAQWLIANPGGAACPAYGLDFSDRQTLQVH